MMNKYYIFRKMPATINLVNQTLSSDEMKCAANIVATYEQTNDPPEDFWVFREDHEDLNKLIAWHDMSHRRFYSVELDHYLFDLWVNEAAPFLNGERGVISSELYAGLSTYLQDAEKIIRNFGGYTMLFYSKVKLYSYLRSALDNYADACCDEAFDIYFNAFKLELIN